MIWNCGNYKIEYGEKVLIMGIVNVTPDSFSDGGDNFSPEKAVESALQMEKDGADIIDIGGQSTRPGHIPVSVEEEWERLEPVLKALNGKINVPISVDTFYPYVAEKAVKFGVSIINDVSGTISNDMANVIKNSNTGWIIMHNGEGNTAEIKEFFENTAKKLETLGINKNQICFDMGIGFGKTRQQDMSLISNIPMYKLSGYPLLLGTSRKRVIKEGTGQENPKLRIYGNIAADTAAIFGGVDVIRMHDVANEKQGIYMAEALKKSLK
ncbi:MAG: dihydropteroate synthase [Eubacterium sp.]|nr:dihydropteroate synthase [Eubacterium sp.]